MPAPAVIPAPIAYIKVVAVKKLVVGFRNAYFVRSAEMASTGHKLPSLRVSEWRVKPSFRSSSFTLRKLECSKQA